MTEVFYEDVRIPYLSLTTPDLDKNLVKDQKKNAPDAKHLVFARK